MFKVNRSDLIEYLMLHKWPYWISAFVVGIVAVIYSKLVVQAESFSNHLLEHAPEYFLVSGPLFFLLSWAMVYFIAPQAKGSGIPQVMAAVESLEKNSDDLPVEKLLGIKIALVKIGSSILCLMGGGAIGREGPTIQISASIFYFASKKINFFKQYVKTEVWIITGAAAGLAAAFNTPLGGLVYAIEELATQHVNKFKTSLIAAVIISGFTCQMILGPYLFLGFPKVSRLPPKMIPFVVVISLLCGLLGALFGQSMYYFSQLKKVYIKTPRYTAMFAMFCGLVISLIALFVDRQVMSSGKELLISFLFTEESMNWYIPVLRFIGPIITNISGCAGGIFAPSLAAGGSIGKLFADLSGITDSNLFVILGMISFLAGVTRAPFTAFILVVEMTDRHSAIFPMMLCSLLATNVAKLVNKHSFYELYKSTYLPQKEEDTPA